MLWWRQPKERMDRRYRVVEADLNLKPDQVLASQIGYPSTAGLTEATTVDKPIIAGRSSAIPASLPSG
jgi:hypothetical protein